MSAPAFSAHACGEELAAADTELARLQAAIAIRLRRAGVRLPEAEMAALADELLGDAVRICLTWMESG
jgi:hypothetical protein